MEVAKPGREMELLWVSRQRERGLQHRWVGVSGGRARGETQGGRARGDGSVLQGEQGRQGQAAGWAQALGRGLGQELRLPGCSLPEMPALNMRLHPWRQLSHWVPALRSWRKGQLTPPCLSQLSGHIQSLGLSNPASPCPAIFACTKPDNLARGDSLRCLIRNMASSVQPSPPQVFLSISPTCRSCMPGPGSTRPVYQALKATAARLTPAHQGPFSGCAAAWSCLQPTLHEPQPSKHFLLLGDLGQPRSSASQFSQGSHRS